MIMIKQFILITIRKPWEANEGREKICFFFFLNPQKVMESIFYLFLMPGSFFFKV